MKHDHIEGILAMNNFKKGYYKDEIRIFRNSLLILLKFSFKFDKKIPVLS